MRQRRMPGKSSPWPPSADVQPPGHQTANQWRCAASQNRRRSVPVARLLSPSRPQGSHRRATVSWKWTMAAGTEVFEDKLKKDGSSWQDVLRLPNTLWQGGRPECLTSFFDTLRVWWRLSSSLYKQGSIHRGSGHWPNLARWSACCRPKMTSGNLAEAGCRWPLGAARKVHLRLKPRSLAALISGPPKGMGVWALQVWAQGP